MREQNATSEANRPSPGPRPRPAAPSNKPKRQPNASPALASGAAPGHLRKRGNPPTTSMALAEDRRSTSSVPVSGAARAPQKRRRPSTAAGEDEHHPAKRLKDCDDAETADKAGGGEEVPTIPFEETTAGRLCAQRGISNKIKPWVPIPCFVCEEGLGEKGRSTSEEPRKWEKWGSFRRHIVRCASDKSTEWPRCHFCKELRDAFTRPDLMGRHVVGLNDYRPCKRLLRGGLTTNGDLVDWLVGKNLPIHEKFLGDKLSKALNLARHKGVGRDEKHMVPLRPVRPGQDDEGDSDEESMDE